MHRDKPSSMRFVMQSITIAYGKRNSPARGCGTYSASTCRLKVEWSGTARLRPSRWRMGSIGPAV
jgi:hypothetical protein